MKSIFYNPLDVRIHQKNFEEVKTLISEQESLGNKVLLAKINEDVIFVQIKDSTQEWSTNHYEVNKNGLPILQEDPLNILRDYLFVFS